MTCLDFAEREKIQGLKNLNVPNSGNVPRLRFPEFSGEWVKVSLLEICERVTRKNKNNRSKLPLTISAQYGLVDQITFFNKVVASADMSNYYLLKKGEFAYNKSYSSDYPWGAIKRLDRYDEGALSSLYICFNIRKCTDSDFAVQYFESPKWYREVSNIAGEGARNHGLLNIAVGDFFNTKHYLPSSIDEQKKIAKLLLLLDQRIATQNKIIQQLQSLIKGIRVNLFSFDNYSIKYLGELCSITTGKLDANAMVVNGKYPFFTCAEETFRIDEYAFDTEALLISGNGANLGYIHYYNGKFNAYQRTYVLDKFAIDVMYIKYYLETFLNKRINQEVNVGNTPYIVLSTLTKMRIKIPDILIQQRIVTTIKSLKEKLLNEKLALIKYEEQKKFLLSNMFI